MWIGYEEQKNLKFYQNNEFTFCYSLSPILEQESALEVQDSLNICFA